MQEMIIADLIDELLGLPEDTKRTGKVHVRVRGNRTKPAARIELDRIDLGDDDVETIIIIESV